MCNLIKLIKKNGYIICHSDKFIVCVCLLYTQIMFFQCDFSEAVIFSADLKSQTLLDWI